ncbi:DUF4830 domain-containing protein [Caproiciproducens galactitolivorans]|uniref:DUF4830 domain-containing protein n=1 Tax=Caproiciproducens galactitolivorans TaxID=642589 RepID=A0ABT4BYQ0_9FIRM|nr:DUF4830 domain-containing protein [Caproiciproducens galactitolivorans]MCY1715063.1 DUF4830 domain-containing protein [Caproiciproducens galactitolivorans]
MFVLSVKAGRKKVLIGLAAVLIVVTGVIVTSKVHSSSPVATASGKQYCLTAATNEDRISFLKQFGWNVNAEPIEMKDVTIPEKFNDVYTQYNNIQKEQGLDLMPYAGKTCKQWVYAVTNYPQASNVRATMLVYNNAVIGGDLSTAELDGFMTGFNGAQESADYSMQGLLSACENQASSAAPAVSSEIPANAWPTD